MNYFNLCIGLLLGALIWALSPLLTGEKEPWDGAFAYYFGSLFLAGVISALSNPSRWWIGSLGVYLGQFAFIFIAHGFGNLWPLGLIIGGVFMIVSFVGGLLVFGAWRFFFNRKETPERTE